MGSLENIVFVIVILCLFLFLFRCKQVEKLCPSENKLVFRLFIRAIAEFQINSTLWMPQVIYIYILKNHFGFLNLGFQSKISMLMCVFVIASFMCYYKSVYNN